MNSFVYFLIFGVSLTASFRGGVCYTLPPTASMSNGSCFCVLSAVADVYDSPCGGNVIAQVKQGECFVSEGESVSCPATASVQTTAVSRSTPRVTAEQNTEIIINETTKIRIKFIWGFIPYLAIEYTHTKCTIIRQVTKPETTESMQTTQEITTDRVTTILSASASSSTVPQTTTVMATTVRLGLTTAAIPTTAYATTVAPPTTAGLQTTVQQTTEIQSSVEPTSAERPLTVVTTTTVSTTVTSAFATTVGKPVPCENQTNLTTSGAELNAALKNCGFDPLPIAVADQYATIINSHIGESGIKSRRELAMFLANVFQETGGLTQLKEPPTKKYMRNGKDYRGRGLLHLTGYTNYKAASKALFNDDRLVKKPDLVSDDKTIAVRTAFWFWKTEVRRGARAAKIDAGDFETTIGAINPGELKPDAAPRFKKAAQRRRQFYAKIKEVLCK